MLSAPLLIDLSYFYSACDCLIAASYGEGYGLPIAEAQTNQTPIICRDIKVFREISYDVAYFFEGNDPLDIVVTIKKWLNLFSLNLHPKNSNPRKISWDESAQDLLDKIEEFIT